MRGASKKSKADKFVNFLTKQIRENRTKFFTVIGFSAGFIIIGLFIFLRFQTLNQSASDRLSAAHMALMYGDQVQAVTHLNNAIIYSKNTPAAYQARLVRADMLMESGEYAKALPLLKETEERGKPELIRPLALFRIIYAYEQQDDYSNAILSANDFVNKYSDNFLIRSVYSGLARYYMLAGSPEDAKRVYGEIMVKFPATADAEQAEKALRKLN